MNKGGSKYKASILNYLIKHNRIQKFGKRNVLNAFHKAGKSIRKFLIAMN